jgi:alpha-1,6-mannosyltransferase
MVSASTAVAPLGASFDARHLVAETTRVSIAHAPLPPNDRPGAELSVLDITKWFGEASGGVRTYLTEKARYVAARATLRQVLVVPGPFDGYSLGSGVRTYRLRGPLIPTQTAYRFLFATRSTRRVIEHERPDLIEVGSPFFVPWVTAMASRRLQTPLVAFHHTSLATLPRSLALGGWAGRAWTRMTGAYVRRLSRLFRTTVVASDFAGDELRALGIERLSHVPLGVDLEHFRPGRADRVQTRRRFALPLDRPVVLYVGRLAREKRLDVVLDGWPAVERATGAVLVIAGAGREEQALRTRAGDAAVTWLPYQADREMVARLHGAADLYLSPGEWETFGLSALEAMASGVPVVTPASGAGWELVQRSGAGAGYEPGSPADMARAVIDVLGAPGNGWGGRARGYAEREHGWSTVFDRLFTTYREVLAR